MNSPHSLIGIQCYISAVPVTDFDRVPLSEDTVRAWGLVNYVLVWPWVGNGVLIVTDVWN